MTSPTEATRAELRYLLYDLADQLLHAGAGRHVLLDAIRHADALADLAGVPEGLTRTVLRNLHRDLIQHPAGVERLYFAQQLTSAADHL